MSRLTVYDFIRNSICLGDRIVTFYPYTTWKKGFVLGTVTTVGKKSVMVQIDDPEFPKPIRKWFHNIVVIARGVDESPPQLKAKKKPRRPLVNKLD